ncbi:MAG: response regulator [Deltaproteobacteria bacterium]|nr:response regulator [Deltaproteobacteria bacterium]
MELRIEKPTTSDGSPCSACRSAPGARGPVLQETLAEPSPPLKRSILVVDDQKSIRDILFHLLTGMGFQVTVAGDGAEGWERFHSGRFDLVLTDLHMPVMDGWRLASRIKQDSPATPIVLLTGEGRGRVLEKLDQSDIDEALFKPFTLNDLEKTVLRILEKEQGRHL